MGCGISNLGNGGPGAPSSAFKSYYTLSDLGDRVVFGPFVKLVEYDPQTHGLRLSVLLVCKDVPFQQHEGHDWAPHFHRPLSYRRHSQLPQQRTSQSQQPQPPQQQPDPDPAPARQHTLAWALHSVGVNSGDASAAAGPGNQATAQEAKPAGQASGQAGAKAGVADAPAEPIKAIVQAWPSQTGPVPMAEINATAPPAAGTTGMDAVPQPTGKGRKRAAVKAKLKQAMLGEGRATSRTSGAAGTKAGGSAPAEPKAQTVKGELLHSWRDWRFWRFIFEATCTDVPQELSYQVDAVPGRSFSLALPARAAPWHWGFTTCNGLDDPANAAATRGMAPLWADFMARHAARPMHAMVGGGDQLYNDAVFEGPLLKGWDQAATSAEMSERCALPFSEAMRAEVEEFYFAHYCVHFSQPLYRDALASIPSVNMWDDHDIFDGWGSYPEHILQSPVMQGVYAAARLFYHLFQQHTTPERAAADGLWSGTSSLHFFGDATAVVVPDTRSFRTPNQVCPPSFYTQLRERLRALPGSVRHVVLVLTVPILYPKVDTVEALTKLGNIITETNTQVDTFLRKAGLRRLLPMRFGMIEVLDDLLDHWDAPTHEKERDEFLQMLMELSAEKGFRISFLSGDVHCGGYGLFHSRGGVPEAEVPRMPRPDAEALATDPRFMPQIISSAIVNVPPPKLVLALLRQLGEKPKPVLHDCVERMEALVTDGQQGDLLIGERNWCEVAEEPSSGCLAFELRCEQVLGSGQVRTRRIEVPPLRR